MGQPALKASDHSSRAPRQRRLPILPDSSSFHRKRIKTALMIGAVTLFAILAIASLLCAQKWPFTRKRVVNDLEQATLSTVEIKNFQQTYFPHPGCIAVGLTFRRNQDLRTPPLIAIRRLTIEGSYSGVISKHVSILRAEGMHVIVPPLGTDPGRSQQKGAGEKETVIGKIIADGALLVSP